MESNTQSNSDPAIALQQTNADSVNSNSTSAKLFAQIAEKIIEQQEQIIGPVAVEQAKQVTDLTIDWANHAVLITGDGATVIDDLVKQYRELFGQISVEVCKDAASKFVQQLTPDQLPDSLR